MAIWLVTIILFVAMLLLITERLPVDLTSIGIMVALILSGILTPKEAIAGFASPAVITVGSMFRYRFFGLNRSSPQPCWHGVALDYYSFTFGRLFYSVSQNNIFVSAVG